MTQPFKESQESWLDTPVNGIEMDDVNEQVESKEVTDLREQVRRLTSALDQAHQRYEELVSAGPESIRREAPSASSREVESLLRTKTFRWLRPLRVIYGSIRFRGAKRVPKTPHIN
jgi:hypothetical protein